MMHGAQSFKMAKLIRNILLIVCLWGINPIWAITPTAEEMTMWGTDFWVCYLPQKSASSGSTQLFYSYLIICTASPTDVTIELPKSNWKQTLHLQANKVEEFKIPTSGISAYSIAYEVAHVTTTEPICLYSAMFAHCDHDVTRVLPVKMLGKSYVIETRTNLFSTISVSEAHDATTVGVIVVEDNTHVRIEYPDGLIIDQIMNKGDTHTSMRFPIQVKTNGTTIEADKPVAVFEGCDCSVLYAEACDQTYEQVLPNDYFGQEFVVLTSNRKYDMLIIFHPEDDIQVTVNDSILPRNREAFECDTVRLRAPQDHWYVHSSKPVACHLYFAGGGTMEKDLYDGLGDPMQLQVIPWDQPNLHMRHARFDAVKYSSLSRYRLNIVTETANVDSMYIDCWHNQAQFFKPVQGRPDLSYASISISSGFHRIDNPSGDFLAYTYGLGSYEAYAYNIAPLPPWTDTVVIYDTICSNRPLYFNNRWLDSTGVYYDSALVVCEDTVYELHLQVYEPEETFTQLDTCLLQSSIQWYEHTITKSGMYEHIDSLISIHGCDSISHLRMVVLQGYDTTEQAIVCAGKGYLWHDKYYLSDTLVTDTMQTLLGCDSICHLQLKVSPPTTKHVTYEICRGEKILINGKSYKRGGEYTDVIPNSVGCDSILHITLVEKDCSNETIPLNPWVDCDTTYSFIDTLIVYDQLKKHPLTWFGKTYSSPGVYRDTLPDANIYECDSVGTLVLRVLLVDTIKTCLAQTDYMYSTEWGTYLLSTLCDSITGSMLLTEDNQSLVIGTIYIKGGTSSSSLEVKDVYPSQMPWEWNGLNINADGEYTTTIPNAAGCDSVMVLRVHVILPCELPTETLPIKWQSEP